VKIDTEGLMTIYESDEEIASLGTLILSRIQVEQWIPKEKYPLISIRDVSESPLSGEVKQKYLEVLDLCFSDVIESCLHPSRVLISNDDAENLYNFFNKWIDKPMIIHCKGGVSRSAGVAVAKGIMEHDWLLVSKIISSDKFSPNPTVIRKMLAYTDMIGDNPLKRII